MSAVFNRVFAACARKAYLAAFFVFGCEDNNGVFVFFLYLVAHLAQNIRFCVYDAGNNRELIGLFGFGDKLVKRTEGDF